MVLLQVEEPHNSDDDIQVLASNLSRSRQRNAEADLDEEAGPSSGDRSISSATAQQSRGISLLQSCSLLMCRAN